MQNTLVHTNFSHLFAALGVGLIICAAALPARAQAPTPAAKPAAKPAPSENLRDTEAQGASDTDALEARLAQAQLLLQNAVAAFNAGNYASSEQEARSSLALSPSASAGWYLAQSLDLQGKTSAAIDAYRGLLAAPDVNSLGTNQERAQARLKVLESIPATLTLDVVPTDATVLVDGQNRRGPWPLALSLTPGSHQVTVQAEGYQPKSLTLDVSPSQKLSELVELEEQPKPVPPPVAATPPPPAPRVTPRSRLPAYITLGVAGSSAIVGTIFGVRAMGAQDDFDAAPTTSNADAVERNALIADMAFGIAITLGITGVVLLTTDPPTERQVTAHNTSGVQLSLAPYASRTGGGATARLTF